MKKILVFILCALLLCAMPLVALADEIDSAPTETETVPEENVTPEEEIATEGEISGVETEEEKPEKSMTEIIKDYFTANLEEFSVIGTLIVGIIYKRRRDGKLDISLGTLNNNAVKIAEKSTEAVKNIAAELTQMKTEFATLLASLKKTADEKKSLEETLNSVETFIRAEKLAVIELSNEVANLLVLANIPNSVKEELNARHVQAMHEIEALEVKGNDGINS